MLSPVLQKNDYKARWLIGVISVVIFMVIVALGRIKLNIHLPFNAHVFATLNVIINASVSVLLIAALTAVKLKKYIIHKRLMLSALILSVVFLVSYIAHHLLAGETKFGGEGSIRYFYFFILSTHIFLASIILPFILFTAYRALVGEWPAHRKLARITWPIWFYVAVTGVVVYFLIHPYYN